MPVTQVPSTNAEVSNPALNSNDTAGGSNLDNRFVHQIGGQLFYIELWMYNQIKNFKPFAVPFFFVDGLAIEENLDDWNTKGWITLSTDYEMIERGSIPAKDREKIDAPFLFRTDGRNKINIKIYPITIANNSSSDSQLPPEQWEMAYNFVVYDIEDIKTNSATKKTRKFYFWDERYQILLERNIEWSTALYGPNKGNILAKDTERSMPVSDAIKSIIQTAASNSSDGISSNGIKVGSSKGGKFIDDPDQSINIFDLDNWDAGCSSGEPNYEGSVLYTSPANRNALEDLNYVYSLFKSEDNSPAFLDLDRYDRVGGKRFKLISLKKIIQEANNNQVERIVINDNQEITNSSPYFARAPYNQNEDSVIRNFQSGIASMINNYKFVSMVPIDDLNLTNKPVHNYNFSQNQFNVFYTNNTAKDVLENMKNIAKEGLHSFSQQNKNNEAQLLFNFNKTKSSGLMTSNCFIQRTFFPTDMSMISMLKDFLMLNQALYFNATGLTIRTPGKFLFVDRDSSTADKNPFDDKFLGQWLITKIVHYFDRESYTTDVICTKIDIFSKWWEELDDKY